MHYKLSQIASITGGTFLGDNIEIESIVTDSRSLSCEIGVSPMFVAMKGMNHDSHDFIKDMYNRGIRAFLVERPIKLPRGAGCIIVKNSINALQLLAAHWRSQFKGKVVGITGSNGKTGTKEWIAQEIPKGIKFFRSPKSSNSQLGVPLSMFMLRGDEDLAIFEAGISKPNEMKNLEQIIRPDIVILTSIGDAHQENFLNIEQKCNEKLRLAKNAQTVIYHSYYEILNRLINEKFSLKRLIDAASFKLPRNATITNDALKRNAQIVGAFFNLMGWTPPTFQKMPKNDMRLELEDGIYNSILVKDFYNSNLSSLVLALDYLRDVALGRKKTLILSDILENGLSEKMLYSRVSKLVKEAQIDFLIGVGTHIQNQSYLFDCEKEFYVSTDECINRISRRALAERAVLLKGARKFQFEKLAHALEKKSHTTILEIDLDAMIHNLNYYRAKLKPDTKIMAVVKANSYGAGNFEIAQILQYQGVDYLAVAFTDEGVLLRERGITMPIVVLNADAESFDQMIANRLEPEIYNLKSLHDFVRALHNAHKNQYPIHIKLDTGMHRFGFMGNEINTLCKALKKFPELHVASIFSHFHSSDVIGKEKETKNQILLFDKMSKKIIKTLGYPVIRHISNSAGVERFPEAQFDMCRLGIGLYGFGIYKHNKYLHPISSLKTRIVQIKHLMPGDTVGYGAVKKVTRPTITATISVGFADGLNRHLGCENWSVLVLGRPATIIGKICMDSCMIDVTEIPNVKEGDEAIIFSAVKGNDLETMAKILDTTPTEILNLISSRVKRIYLKK